MKFAVVGSGGVGAYFGGRLAEAGHEVTFVARGAHLEALRSRGLRVASTEGDFEVVPVRVVARAAELPAVDFVLLGVKTWQVREAVSDLGAALSGGGAVLTLQNGVEAPDEVASLWGEAAVLPGLCRLMSYVEAPGVIRHAGVRPRIEFGETSGAKSPRVEALLEAFSTCRGVVALSAPDIQAALWDKFLFIAPFSAMGAATRKPAGLWRDVPEARRMLEAAMREVVTLARARGVNLPDEAVARTMGFVDRLQADATASMQRDLLDGKPSELEAQTGAIVRLAAAASVSVPVNEFLYSILLPGERQARS